MKGVTAHDGKQPTKRCIRFKEFYRYETRLSDCVRSMRGVKRDTLETIRKTFVPLFCTRDRGFR